MQRQSTIQEYLCQEANKDFFQVSKSKKISSKIVKIWHSKT